MKRLFLLLTIISMAVLGGNLIAEQVPNLGSLEAGPVLDLQAPADGFHSTALDPGQVVQDSVIFQYGQSGFVVKDLCLSESAQYMSLDKSTAANSLASNLFSQRHERSAVVVQRDLPG